MIETVLHATYEQIVRPETVESLGKEAKRSSGLPSDVSDQTPMYGSRLRRGEGLKWAATAISVLVVTLHPVPCKVRREGSAGAVSLPLLGAEPSAEAAIFRFRAGCLLLRYRFAPFRDQR